MTTSENTPATIEDDNGIRHIPWCQEHTNEDPEGSPECGLCTSSVELDFHGAAKGTDDSAFVKATLEFAACDIDFGYPTDIVYLYFNRGGHDPQAILPWKGVPLAFALLSADARSRGDEESAKSFAQMAQSAIDHRNGERIPQRMEDVDRARYSAQHREGMMAAYRELGRRDLIPALLKDMDWLDRRSPEEPPSMNRASVLPTTRTAPDGTVLDLTLPLIDRDGRRWFWAGYSTTGQPLVSRRPDGEVVTMIAEAYDSTGPFTQSVTMYLHEEVLVIHGRAAGHRGIVDEVDLTDPKTPLRVRFDEENDPVIWVGLNDVEFAGSAK